MLILYSSRRLRSVAGIVLLVLNACYNVVPLTIDPPPPNQEVIVDFTDAGGERLGGLLGRAVTSARGHVVAWTADTITLSVVSTTTIRGAETFWQGERAAIPRESVARVRERRLDRTKTGFVAVGALALIIGAFGVVSGRSSGTPRPPNGGPPR